MIGSKIVTLIISSCIWQKIDEEFQHHYPPPRRNLVPRWAVSGRYGTSDAIRCFASDAASIAGSDAGTDAASVAGSDASERRLDGHEIGMEITINYIVEADAAVEETDKMVAENFNEQLYKRTSTFHN